MPPLLHRYALLLTCLVLAVPWTARAGQLEPIYAPTAPSIAFQLAADTTVVPADQAALFVPALAEGHTHPRITLVNDGRVTSIAVGQRELVEPGHYVVLVGSGSPEDAVSVSVIAEAGRTTVVPVRWGGLDLVVELPRGKELEEPDVIVRRARTERTISLPSALATEDPPSVLLLAPGLYEIESRSRGDIVSVHVPEGGLVRFEVTARTSGKLVGSQVVPTTIPEPVGDADDGWTLALILGADASVGQSSGVVGVPNLFTATGSATVEVDSSFRKGPHQLMLGGGLQMGAFLFQSPGATSFPLVKTRDNLHLDVEYRIHFRKGLGLYARGAGGTQILPTAVPINEPLTLHFEQLDGSVDNLSLGANQRVRIAEAFSPTRARAGVGLFGDLVDKKAITFGVRLGGAYRLYWFRGAFVSEDDPSTPGLEFRQVEDQSLLGAEGTVDLVLRASRVLRLATAVDVFVPFVAPAETIISWEGGLQLDVGAGFALQYKATLDWAPQITSNLSFQQAAGVRWTFDAL